jgi:hypothetical protein
MAEKTLVRVAAVQMAPDLDQSGGTRTDNRECVR